MGLSRSSFKTFSSLERLLHAVAVFAQHSIHSLDEAGEDVVGQVGGGNGDVF